MFFMLYALGLVVVGAGMIAGMALWAIGAIYAFVGCAALGIVGAVRAFARRSGRALQAEHRRREAPSIRA